MKTAEYRTPDGEYLGEELPPGYEVVPWTRDMGRKAEEANAAKTINEIMPWLMAGGAGLIGHTVASSLMDGERKRKKTAWEKLVDVLVPMGVAGVGGYGGYLLGKSLGSEKAAQAKLKPAIDMNAEREKHESPWANAIWGASTGAIPLFGTGAWAGKGWLDWAKMPKEIGPTPEQIKDYGRQIDSEMRRIEAKEKANLDIERRNSETKGSRSRAAADVADIDTQLKSIKNQISLSRNPKVIRELRGQQSNLMGRRAKILDASVELTPFDTSPHYERIKELVKERGAKTTNKDRALKFKGNLGRSASMIPFIISTLWNGVKTFNRRDNVGDPDGFKAYDN